ncbi:acetyl-CoA carboxylase biotin carboxyl carrier protein subunit [uncultured Rummeliibacillus sp.]|uniref:acetyl-CoA carboxylase biotin carboxyl carrier protein subunit n=1 Tax=uncultured Rummeliibacillus sp. TaxID=762292 RepID=UPI002625C870|nr:acetyl-CoA carboxylase biotin carboxyl carrier protein subunit [uncultured Rummeliibacillus sp.]
MMNIKSTMAGIVFHIDVKLGEEIKEGQTVVILESMKMEIPIESTVNGVVSEILVQEGDFVNENDSLVVIS